jgi:hypothetical protein
MSLTRRTFTSMLEGNEPFLAGEPQARAIPARREELVK